MRRLRRQIWKTAPHEPSRLACHLQPMRQRAHVPGYLSFLRNEQGQQRRQPHRDRWQQLRLVRHAQLLDLRAVTIPI